MKPQPSRGRLKIYLGYAAGVGKTYQMLSEAQALKASGCDVVIGYFEPHARQDTIDLTEGLETIPRRAVDYRDTRFEEMDTDAILRRAPAICLIDEFPHSNVPGSPRAKRWEDALLLIDRGLDIYTTMNVQHLESLNDQIWQISGVRVRETIPDWVLRQADEVVMVDLTPRALLNRLERGVVYSSEKAALALQNFFKESTLIALRELALRETALESESRHTVAAGAPALARSDERILVLITPQASSLALIRRARRVATYLNAECFAVAVVAPGQLERMPAGERSGLERHLEFARSLHLETRTLEGANLAQTLIDFARLHHITQVFVSHPAERPAFTSRLKTVLRKSASRSLVHEIVHLAGDMQVTVVAERRFAATRASR